MPTTYYGDASQDAIAPEELRLYHLIMEYRATKGLPALPLSLGLTVTGARHTIDTVGNLNNFPGHSWSDAPYNPADPATYETIWRAPARIGTTYQSAPPDTSFYGYEISASITGPAVATATMTPEAALAGWQGSPPHNDVMTNAGFWTAPWNAIGIGLYKGVAHVWFGNSLDPGGPPLIEGTANGDTLAGTAFADRIYGLAGADALTGGDGNDALVGGADGDGLGGGGGADFLFGAGFSPDGSFAAGSGDDTLNGGDGDDGLWGGDGADTMNGDAGNDGMAGGGGNDAMNGGDGNDFLFGGDFSVVNGSRLPNSGDDALNGASGNDALYGFDGNDIINGEAGNDYVEAGEDNDVVNGGADSDTLLGQAGNDTINGGTGFDYLYGGAGADVFSFRKGDSYDTAWDFSAAQGDKLRLDPTLGITTFAQFQAKLTGFTFESVTYSRINFASLGSNDEITVGGIAHTAWTAGMVEFA